MLMKLIKGVIPNDYWVGRDAMITQTKALNATSSFADIFSTLWYAKLPCYDTLDTRPSKLIFLQKS